MGKITGFKHRVSKKLTTLLLLFSSSLGYAQYCIPSFVGGCDGGFTVNTFILNGENSTGFNDVNTGCSAGGYDDRTAQPAVVLGQGVTYTATISSEYNNGTDGMYCAIWIDFNNNNAFEVSEIVTAYNSFLALTGSPVPIVIPASAALGSHRMRVMAGFPYDENFNNVSAGDFDPCGDPGNILLAEAHDYNITVVGPPSCLPPAALNVSGVTLSGATLGWTENGTATQWNIQYGTAGFALGTGTSVSASGTPSYTISSGLIVGTSYDFYVRAACSGTDLSSWVGPLTFLMPLANDECAGAIDISDQSVNSSSNSGATQTLPGGNCANGTIANDIWYKVTASSNGDITIEQNVPNFEDMILEVVSGDCTDPVEIDCVENAWDSGVNTLAFAATAGTTYYIRTYGWAGAQPGNFSLSAAGTALPVTMGRLAGKLAPGNVPQLTWHTFSEQNNSGFEVQYGTDAKNFRKISFVPSIAPGGNSKEQLSYRHTDNQPVNGTAYYRLMQIDKDGKANYSNVISLTGKDDGIFRVTAAPNPATSSLVVRTYGKQGANSAVCITDLTGKIVQSQKVTGTQTSLDIKNLAQGLYLIRYTDTEHTQTIKISKQ